MVKVKKEIEIEETLLLRATQELPMSIDDFIEFCIRTYIQQDSNTSSLLKRAVTLQVELNRITDKLYKEQTRNKNIDNTEIYEKAMDTVYRIHNELGYIGKNQLQQIGNRYDFNIFDWLHYVEGKEDIVVMNFGAIPKR